MDPLAHTLLGAALARTRLGRDQPLAMPTLVLAANIPDLDVVAYFWSSDAALAFRRGPTHGPIGLAILPLLVAVVVWLVGARWRRRHAAVAAAENRDASAGAASFASLLGLSYLAALTHPALDWLNTYGVRFLYPFDRRWFYGDTLFIVDPWVWLMLGAGVAFSQSFDGRRRAIVAWIVVTAIAAVLLLTGADSTAGKVSWFAAVGAVWAIRIAVRPRTEPMRRRAATASVGVFAVYLAVTIGAAVTARGVVRASIEEPVEQLLVGPLPMSLARREVVAATESEVRYGRFRWFESPRFEWAAWSRPRPRPDGDPVVAAAMRDPSIRGFIGWARFLFVEIDGHPDFWEVHLMDARYTLERNARFGSAVVKVPRQP
jgi:inner membrane protein